MLPKRISKKNLGQLTIIQHADGFALEHADTEVGFTVHAEIEQAITLSNGFEMQMRTLPRVEIAATIIRVGGPDKSVSCFDMLGRWCAAHQYEISGPAREHFIAAPTPDTADEIVTEIQLPITPTTNRRQLLI